MKESLKSEFKTIITFVFARGAPAAINFLSLSFYAHRLLPADYGKYSLGLLWSTFLGGLLFSWLSMSLLRFFEEHKEKLPQLLYTLRNTFFIIAAGLFFISLPLYFVLHQLIFYIFFLTIADAFFQMCLQLLVSRTEPVKYAILSTLNAMLTLALAFLFLNLNLGPLGILLAKGISNLSTLSKIYWNHWSFKEKQDFDKTLIRKCFSYGYPLSLSVIIGILLYGLDRVMLAYFLGEKEAALYALPYDMANQSITLLFMAFQLYFYPLVLKILNSHGEEKARERLAENGKLFLLLILPFMFFLIFFAPLIGRYFTGILYREAFANILPIIAISAVLLGLKAFYYDLAFQITNKTPIQLYLNAFLILFNFVLNLLVIPKYAYMGAAYVSLATTMTGVFLSSYIGRYYFTIPSLISLNNLILFLGVGLLFYIVNNMANTHHAYINISAGILIVIVLISYLFKYVLQNEKNRPYHHES